MEHVHEHGDVLDVRYFVVETPLALARLLPEGDAIVVRGLEQFASRFQDVRRHDIRHRHQVLFPDIVEEQIVAERRLVRTP